MRERGILGEFCFTMLSVVMGLGMILGVMFVPIMVIWTVFNLGLLALTLATPWAWAMFLPSAITECVILLGTMLFASNLNR